VAGHLDGVVGDEQRGAVDEYEVGQGPGGPDEDGGVFEQRGGRDGTRRTLRTGVGRSSLSNSGASRPAARASTRPGPSGRSKYWWIRGRRRSAEITTTDRPISASMAARWATVVVFPSLAPGEVTRMTRCPSSSPVSGAHRAT